MRSVFVVAAFLLSVHVAAVGQELYIRGAIGYSFPAAGETNADYQQINGYQSVSTAFSSSGPVVYPANFSSKPASYTSGVESYFGLGYAISKHVSAELDVNVGIANKKYTYSYAYVFPYSGNNDIIDVTVSRQAKNTIALIPSAVLNTGGEVVNMYARFGIVLPVKTKITEQIHAVYRGTVSSTDLGVEDKNFFSIGYTAAIGADYKLNRRMGVFAEVRLMALTVYIKDATSTGETSNGGPSSNFQNTTYAKKGSYSYGGASLPTYSEPYSNLGVNLGVVYHLSKRPAR
jgi:hypothetical protein